jgi:hypothetical protein
VESELQSAAAKILSVVIPWLKVDDVLAPLVEYALNIVVSIPAATIVSFSHFAMVGDETGLCGFTKEMSSLNSSPHSVLVLAGQDMDPEKI